MRKQYSKPKTELIVFNYRNVVADSGDPEGWGTIDEDDPFSTSNSLSGILQSENSVLGNSIGDAIGGEDWNTGADSSDSISSVDSIFSSDISDSADTGGGLDATGEN